MVNMIRIATITSVVYRDYCLDNYNKGNLISCLCLQTIIIALMVHGCTYYVDEEKRTDTINSTKSYLSSKPWI